MKLARSRSNKLIGGVCSGIAEAFDWDPTIVRVGFLAASLLGTAGIWVYLIAWAVIPAEDGSSGAATLRDMWDQSKAKRQGRGGSSKTFDPYQD